MWEPNNNLSLPFHVKRLEPEAIQMPRQSSATRPRPLRFYAELFVEHSPSDIWSYFVDLARWPRWSPICRGCRLSDDQGELRSGSILEVSFAILGVTLMAPCRVIQFEPPQSITWQGELFGVQATHTYRFIPWNEGTLMCNEETFVGVNPPLKRLMLAWYGASRLSEKSLQGIKRELLV